MLTMVFNGVMEILPIQLYYVSKTHAHTFPKCVEACDGYLIVTFRT